MKIYISGKISGLSESEYTANFRNTEKHVKEKYKRKVTFKISGGGGHMATFYQKPKVVNPLNIKPFLGIKNWHCYMIPDIYNLLKCDAIYMMDNWSQSRGARIELAIALLTKKKILCN
jgi:hypothetical protein